MKAGVRFLTQAGRGFRFRLTPDDTSLMMLDFFFNVCVCVCVVVRKLFVVSSLLLIPLYLFSNTSAVVVCIGRNELDPANSFAHSSRLFACGEATAKQDTSNEHMQQEEGKKKK